MKKVFFTYFLLCLICLNGFSQTYQKVAIPDKTTWLVAQEQLFGRFIDTLYAKNQIDDKIEIWFGSQYNDEQMFLGLLKSNEDNSKLWFTPNGTSKNEELLIFDLTLEKGDTFYLGSTLTKVDTVFYRNNFKYVEFDLSTIWDENLRFIEGVGPNISVAWMVHPGILEPYVVCKYDDDALFYVTENPNFIECTIDATDSEELENNCGIKIYPNPTTGLIKFQNHSYSVKEILVHDTTGRQFFIKNKNDEMDLSDLPDGLYLIKIIWINGITETHKVLKNSF